jgi:hypothetical protein
MWLIVFMLSIVIPLIIFGLVAGRNEKNKDTDTGTAQTV